MSVCISEDPEDSQRWMLKKQRGLRMAGNGVSVGCVSVDSVLVGVSNR